MPDQSPSDLTTQGQRALRQSSHTDDEPGLEVIHWGTVIGGTALLAYGMIRRQGMTDLLVAGLGAAVAARGITQSDIVNRSLKRLALHTQTTQSIDIATSITVEAPVEEVFAYWRDLENLPTFMRHVASVQPLDNRYSRWTVRLPTGIKLEWKAELIEVRENELLAWQSVKGSDIYNEGFLTFRPVFDGQGTEVHIHFIYHPPAGQFGARIAGFFDDLQAQFVREDLRSFKRLIETGELPTIEGQPSARPRGTPNGRYEEPRL